MPRYPYGKTQLIDRFQRKLDEIERTWPMIGSYERVEPYIVPYRQGGEYFELLIYHIESKLWFDNDTGDFIAASLLSRKPIKKGDTVFDLGCNAGAMSVVMGSLAGPDGHVHGFDPYPWNAAATTCNARLNYLHNVSTYPVGLANRSGVITVNPYDSRTYEPSTAAGSQQVKIMAVSEYMHLQPRFLKIDIEGAEYDLFDEQEPQTFRAVELMAIEFHPSFIRSRGIDPQRVLRSIESLGFTLHLYETSAPAYEVDSYVDPHQMFWAVRAAAADGREQRAGGSAAA